VLTFIVFGESGTASDSSNICSKIGSLTGGEIGSPPGPVGWGPSAPLYANTAGGIAGNRHT
jgi:hypothetical protein